MTNPHDPKQIPDDIDVTIVGGAGHVGFPLALVLAEEGLKVLIYDLNDESLDIIASGKLPHMENGAEPLLRNGLKDGLLFVTSKPSKLPDKAIVIITIGTPVDEFLNPVHKAVKECADSLMPHLFDGQLVILRSTVSPGTTEWLARYFESKGKNLKVAFCPERVIQGDSIRELRELPQIISGVCPEAEKESAALLSKLTDEMIVMTPMEAEFAKLFTNAARYIHFATSNEFYMIADAAGLDYNKIYEGMVKNYPRAQQLSRAGFSAGPCLFKDTAQLLAFAKNHFSLGNASIQVNEGLVLHVIQKMLEEHDLQNMTVGLLGMAFKAEIDDNRSSLSYKMKKILALYAHEVLATDPYVTEDKSLLPLETVLEKSDILVLCTPHKKYLNLDFKGKPVVNVWGTSTK